MTDAVVPPPGRLVRLGVVLPDEAGEARRLAHICDLAGIDVVWAGDEVAAATIAGAVQHAVVAVRPVVDEPWARTVTVSIGRTEAEASARADLDPSMAGTNHPSEGGLYGTLEDCQVRVAALAAQGVTDLRCVLPRTPDVHDVVAQLTAVAVGNLTTHGPGTTRSADPPPPLWARRPDEQEWR